MLLTGVVHHGERSLWPVNRGLFLVTVVNNISCTVYGIDSNSFVALLVTIKPASPGSTIPVFFNR
jgi:hypothetical protein